jgi:hypothetical protein
MNGPSAAATAKRGVVRFLRDGGDRRAARCAGARAVGSAHNRKPILTDGSRWPFRPPCWQRSAIGPERTIEKTRLMSLSGVSREAEWNGVNFFKPWGSAPPHCCS